VNQFYRREPRTNIWPDIGSLFATGPDIGSRFATVKLVHRSENKIGQSMAAMGIANVHFMRQQLDPFNMETLQDARCWYSRAEALCPALGAADDSTAALAQRNLVCSNSLALHLYAGTRFLHQQVRLCGLVNVKHYNGRCGTVHGVHEPARYAVRLHATRDMEPAVSLLVHERNFARV
jgi:hypothetical protein